MMIVPLLTNHVIRQTRRTLLMSSFSLCIVAMFSFPIQLCFADDSNKASSAGNKAKPTDWTHWRGPLQNGHSLEKGLPDSFKADGENLLWRKEQFATRATPIVMNGRLYTICRSEPETKREAEKTVCVNAMTGELIWESIHNIFLSDAPPERVGWASLVGDPETDKVYMLGLGCLFQCLDGKTGKVLWEKSMLEEYGMLSTYGGRTNFPVIFEDMVFISGVMTGWGDTAVPAHRIIAMDKSTGAPIWFMSTRVRPEDTSYSTPIFTVLNGQAAMVLGSADGAVYALQPRTGKIIWKYQASPRFVNVTPIVEDGIVYCAHGEQIETDRTVLGAIFAIDGNTTGDIKHDELLWVLPAKTVSKSSPVKIGNRIYFVDDSATMLGINAKTGVIEVEKKLGRSMFGSPVVSEGKIYIGENNGKIYSLKPNENSIETLGKTTLDGNEVFGSFAISNGRLYLPTTTALYCIGKSEIKVDVDPMPKLPTEGKLTDKTVAHIQVCPVELLLSPGQKVKLQVRAYNAAGQYLRLLTDATTSVDGGGSVNDELMYTAPSDSKGSVISVTATSGELKSTARGRVIPPLPWKFDFEEKKVPVQWIGASYRHLPIELPSGGNGLVKISTIPKGVRSQAFMGKPNVHDYTVQADVYALDTKNKVPTTKLPDMGVVNQRYTLALEGSQRLQIRSWLSLQEDRFAKTIPFEWQANTWYTIKLRSNNKDGKALLQGKVWKTSETEPAEWTVEGEDALPNTIGSPGLFGNSTDAEFFVDNVVVNAN